jgi:hypothetical protein
MTRNADQGGAVMETPNDPSLAVLHAILADFNVGGSALKTVHVDFLDKVCTTVGMLAHEKWSIVLFGRTSRTGSPQTNRALAERRRQAVESYLRLKLSSLWVFDVRFGYLPWVEEMTGGKDDEESDFWRSVEVWLFKGPHKMPKPTPPPSPEKSGKKWECLRLWLEGTQASFGPIQQANFRLGAVTSEINRWFIWPFHLDGLGVDLPIAKGKPPISYGEFVTTASKPIYYDATQFDLRTALVGRLIRVFQGGGYVAAVLRNILPREPEGDYQPIKGLSGTRDLEFLVYPLDVALGVSGGNGILGHTEAMVPLWRVDPCEDEGPPRRGLPSPFAHRGLRKTPQSAIA